jgi:hypothetical protein
MNRLGLFGAAFVLLLCALMLPPRGAQANNPAATIGQYQLMRGSDSYIYLLDTSSGQVWGRARRDTTWQNEGKPTSGKPAADGRRFEDAR